MSNNNNNNNDNNNNNSNNNNRVSSAIVLSSVSTENLCCGLRFICCKVTMYPSCSLIKVFTDEEAVHAADIPIIKRNATLLDFKEI